MPTVSAAGWAGRQHAAAKRRAKPCHRAGPLPLHALLSAVPKRDRTRRKAGRGRSGRRASTPSLVPRMAGMEGNRALLLPLSSRLMTALWAEDSGMLGSEEGRGLGRAGLPPGTGTAWHTLLQLLLPVSCITETPCLYITEHAAACPLYPPLFPLPVCTCEKARSTKRDALARLRYH